MSIILFSRVTLSSIKEVNNHKNCHCDLREKCKYYKNLWFSDFVVVVSYLSWNKYKNFLLTINTSAINHIFVLVSLSFIISLRVKIFRLKDDCLHKRLLIMEMTMMIRMNFDVSKLPAWGEEVIDLWTECVGFYIVAG